MRRDNALRSDEQKEGKEFLGQNKQLASSTN
jgi:hypothetical protein